MDLYTPTMDLYTPTMDLYTPRWTSTPPMRKKTKHQSRVIPIMGPPKMVSGTHTMGPISLGIQKWEWYGNSMGPAYHKEVPCPWGPLKIPLNQLQSLVIFQGPMADSQWAVTQKKHHGCQKNPLGVLYALLLPHGFCPPFGVASDGFLVGSKSYQLSSDHFTLIICWIFGMKSFPVRG